MSREQAFIDALRRHARDPAARGLQDDVAVLPAGARDLVLSHDMIVEGRHFLARDAPADVAWKLVGVNLSDLAAKGAVPCGLLVGYPLAAEAEWDQAFAEGLAAAAGALGVPLLGGDTVAVPVGSARQLGATALGWVAAGGAPSRSGAQAGDVLGVTGAIDAAGLGLACALGTRAGPAAWLEAYRRPKPRLAEGRALAPIVHAMADVSDGLLIDAARMARASGVAVEVALDRVPLAPQAPDTQGDRLTAAAAGDDYELLFAASALTDPQPLTAHGTIIGRFVEGSGLTLTWGGAPIALPDRLGYEHGDH